MKPTARDCLESALLGGSVASIAAPLLWPLVMLVDPPTSPPSLLDAPALLAGLSLVVMVALAAGIGSALAVGFPALWVVNQLGVSYFYAVPIGACIGVVVVLAFFSWPPQPSFSLVTYGTVLGAVGGWVGATALRRTRVRFNSSVQSGPPSASADL